MFLRLSLFMLSMFLFGANANAEWISFSNSKSNSLNSNFRQAPVITKSIENGNIKMKIKISGFEAEEVSDNGQKYTKIDLLSESASHLLPGSPDIPFITKNFAVPIGHKVQVNFKAVGQLQELKNYRVSPVKEAYLEGSLEPNLYANYSNYNSSEIYPKGNYKINSGMKFRDFEICQVQIFPVQYLASANKLLANTEFEVEVNFVKDENISAKINTSPIKVSPAFAKLYEANIENYEDLKKSGIVTEDGRDVMLIIAPDNFAASLNDFASWKTRTGVYSVIKKFSEIGANANNPDIIYNYIKTAYETWEHPPTYVLLVGDYGNFPVKYVTYLDYTLIDEDYFGKVAGDDYIPDILVGRLPAKEFTTLELLISKAMKYEKTPLMTNTSWFKKATVCSNNAYESQVETKRFTAQVMKEEGGFTGVDTLMSDAQYDESNPWGGKNCTVTTQDIIKSLTQGRSFLNYRGEAWTTGWSTNCYSFNNSDLSSVANYDMLTFVTNIGCGVSKFDYDEGNCFAEAYLKLGTKTKHRGAIAFIGPSSNSHTTYNNRIDRGIYIGMFREGLTTPAQALMRGKMMMYNVFGADDHWVKYQFELFNVLGDPSIQIWREVPQYVVLEKPNAIPIGYSQPEFVIKNKATGQPMVNAKVCLSSEEVYIVGYTNEEGKIKFPVTTSKIEEIFITVTGVNVYPLMDSVMTFAQAVHLYPFGKPEISDPNGNNNNLINPNEECRIKFLIKNSGTSNASGVKAVLTLEEDSKSQLVGSNEVSLGDIASNSGGKYAEFTFKTNADIRSEHHITFDLLLQSNEEDFEYALVEEAAACRLVFVSDSILELGEVQNHRLDPGETAYVFVKLKNSGRDAANNIQVTLKCDSSFIEITEPNFTLQNIPAESESSQLARFTVKADASVLINTDVRFKLEFSSNNGTYTYSDIDSFNITIGESNRMDPTGPDAYGYYAYSNEDVIYEQSPVYNWFEISTIGSQLTSMSSGTRRIVELPFKAKFYGKEFNQISVQLYGWFTFGQASNGGAYHKKLPSVDASGNLVAVSWALYNSSWNDESEVYTYYDKNNNRFIIEWYNITNQSYTNGNTTYDTFQAIILDPAYHQTATGDAEIIVQYKNIHMVSTNSVGIQNETKDDGINYIYNGNFPRTGNIIDNGKAVKFTTEKPTTKKLSVNESLMLNSEISIYPQPANNNVYIEFDNPKTSNLSVKLFSESGKEIISKDLGFAQEGRMNFYFELSKSNLTSGVYIIQISNSVQVIGSGKIIIKK